MGFVTGTWSSRLVMLLFLAGSVSLAGCAVRGGGAELRGVVGDAAGPPDGEAAEAEDYDRWERFNERTFAFNHTLDRVVVKPVATGWSKVAPEPLRQGLKNAVRNLGMPRRFVNNLLQLKIEGAVRELTGFVLNSTVGIAGLADVARGEGVAPPDDEDTGQTLALYGIKPGPYLVLPLFPPSTVRDTVGSVVDGLLDPLGLASSSRLPAASRSEPARPSTTAR